MSSAEHDERRVKTPSATREELTASMMQKAPVALLKDVEVQCQALAEATATAMQWRADAARISAMACRPAFSSTSAGDNHFYGQGRSHVYPSAAISANATLTHEPAELLAVKRAHAAYRSGIETLRTWLATAQTAFLDELERMEHPDAPSPAPSPVLAYAPSPPAQLPVDPLPEPVAPPAPASQPASVPDVLGYHPSLAPNVASPANTPKQTSPPATAAGTGASYPDAKDMDPAHVSPLGQAPSKPTPLPIESKMSDTGSPYQDAKSATQAASTPTVLPAGPAAATPAAPAAPSAATFAPAASVPGAGVVDLTMEDEEAAQSAGKVINLASSGGNSPASTSPVRLAGPTPSASAPAMAPVSAPAPGPGPGAATTPAPPASGDGQSVPVPATGETPAPVAAAAAASEPVTSTENVVVEEPKLNSNEENESLPQLAGGADFNLSPMADFNMDDLDGFDFGPPPAGLDLSQLDFGNTTTQPNSARGSFDFSSLMSDFNS